MPVTNQLPMIDLTKINYKYPDVHLYYKGEEVRRFENEVELYQARILIAQQQSTDYQVLFNNELIQIHANGDLEKWPVGLYDATMKCFSELFKLRK
jgi:hypothetical protein